RDNYAASEAAYRQALAIEQKTLGPNSVVVGETLAELALQVSNQQRFDEAANLFQRATPIIEASSSDAARARLDSYRALDAANQRNYSDALKYARQATGARRAELATAAGGVNAASTNGIAASADRGELAHSLRIEAEMALRLGDLASARASGEEALWIISEQPGLPLWWRPDVISLMGEINEHDSRVVVAERDFRDARDLDSKLFGDTGPTAIADLRLGRFYSDQQLYPASVDAYRKGFAILAKDADARSQVIPDQIVPFITAAAAAGGDGANAEIFRASQLVNSSVADQSIVRVAAREAAATPALADLVRQAQAAAQARDTARVLLAAEYAKDDADRSTAREDQMDANLRAASAHADDLAAQVTQSFPQYAQLADPAPADLSAVQAQLKPGEAMVSFVIGLDGSYALLVTHDGMTIAPLKATEGTLTADIADLRRAFSPTLGKLPEFSLKTSYGLYTDLMAPLEAKLSGVDHLIVVPGAALSDLPFAMLVTAPPQGTNYAQAPWLVRRMAVSQVPSARAFLSLRQEPRVALARPFLGLGDPTFHGAGGTAGAKALGALADYCQEDGGISPDLLRALPPLPDTAREVQAVSARLGGGTVLLGSQATEANLRAQPLDQYAVLYFATHGVLPGQLHCQSEPGLVLSPPAAGAAENANGILSASEIAQLKLNADLVVLSACNTAEAPSGPGGSALEGLADAFFAAGAHSVIASHWEVPSAATEKLMVGVFADPNHADDLAQALRRSQLDLISQGATAHPFYWASFTLIGDGAAKGASAYKSASLEAGH
ncbi:MAG TPA: CHAT domain-containing tetratricopeptide repeat protein, partial [Rhizomicrobium sp.]|nr:CHAT domain-containing tetratricopeptide repeat protein [Rhizomicrobium sp.]